MRRILGPLALFTLAGAASGQCGSQTSRLTSGLAGADGFGSSCALQGDLAAIGSDADPGPFNESFRGSVRLFSRVGEVWSPLVTLTDLNGGADDLFGRSVALDGDLVVVGAPGQDLLADGAGTAIVFQRVLGEWIHLTTLSAPDFGPGHSFGTSVDISGTTIIVGAPTHDGGGTFSGAAYIFEFDGTFWNHAATLTPAFRHPFQFYGDSVAISGGRAVVGSWGDNLFNPGGGAAYVYERIGGVWTEVSILQPLDGTPGENFGKRVDIDGDRIAGTSPSREVDESPIVGGVNVFRRVGAGVWVDEGSLTPSGLPTGANFGVAVSVSSGQVLTSSVFQPDGSETEVREGLLFSDIAGAWTQVRRLTPGGGGGAEVFGFQLTLTPTEALIGALVKRGPGAAYFYNVRGCAPCPADLTGSSDPNDASYGVPDSRLDGADFFYFLDQFVASNLAEADLTGSSDPNDPAYGVPDGTLDGADFFFYLDLFVQGC